MLHQILNFLFPPTCPLTHENVSNHGDLSAEVWSQLNWINGHLCKTCSTTMDFEDETLCAQCLLSPPIFDEARSLWSYNDMARRFLLLFKHGDRIELGYWMAKFVHQHHADLINACDIIIPVPLHRWRLLKRRYNQSLILGNHLSKLSKKPSQHNILIRTRHTQPQSGNKTAREKNIAAAFAVPQNKESFIKDKTILIIDDVFTTGATLNACAKTLKEAGAKKVTCLAIARVC